jgi:hypothetical protein
MAIFTAISIKTQTAGAMRRTLDYVMQPTKTAYQNPETGQCYKLISGQNCMPETAFGEFMNTKERYRKATGVFFKHYVQSFKADCGATPEQIHQMGLELAKRFDGYEVVIATHIDVDHWHSHLIVNSVSCETGLKIQVNEQGLERLRDQSDEICRQFGIEVLSPYNKPGQRAMNHREYRAALKGESWKMKLMSAIDKGMKASRSKAQFIHSMETMGYSVKWIDHYKYITYTTPDGKKCRDNKLFDSKYLKSEMEVYFSGLEQTNGDKQGNKRDIDRAISAYIDWSQTGAMERSRAAYNNSGRGGSREHSYHIETPITGRYGIPGGRGNSSAQYRDRKCQEFSDAEIGGNHHIEAGRGREGYQEDSIAAERGYDGDAANEGFISCKVQNQVGVDWGDIAVDALALAASIEAMVENPKQKRRKAVTPGAEAARKRQKKKPDREWSMER